MVKLVIDSRSSRERHIGSGLELYRITNQELLIYYQNYNLCLFLACACHIDNKRFLPVQTQNLIYPFIVISTDHTCSGI